METKASKVLSKLQSISEAKMPKKMSEMMDYMKNMDEASALDMKGMMKDFGMTDMMTTEMNKMNLEMAKKAAMMVVKKMADGGDPMAAYNQHMMDNKDDPKGSYAASFKKYMPMMKMVSEKMKMMKK